MTPSLKDTLALQYQIQAFEKTKAVKTFIRETYFEQKAHGKTKVSQSDIDRVIKSVKMQSLTDPGNILEEDKKILAEYSPGIFNAITTVDADEIEMLELLNDGMPWALQKMEIGKDTYGKYLDTMACKGLTGLLEYENGIKFDLTFGNGIDTLVNDLTANSTPGEVASKFQKMYKAKKLRSGKKNCDILAGVDFFAMLGVIHGKNNDNPNIKILEDEDGYSWYGWKVLNEQGEYNEADKAQTDKVVVAAGDALMLDRGYKHRILFCVIKIQGDKSEVKEEISNLPLYIKPEIQGNGLATKLNYIGRPFVVINYKSMLLLKK